jgi:AraC-like DNA-binding protein
VVRGTARYLVGDRRYDLAPGALTWLFPAQEHVLIDRSADHVLWWAVFRPRLVARIATAPHLGPLLADDPPGQFHRRLGYAQTDRLAGLFREVRAAQDGDAVVGNAGLAYLLAACWRAFLDSERPVEGVVMHPGVERAVQLLRSEAEPVDVPALAEAVGLSPSHLSRLFTAQVGVPISRYRNQQRLRRFFALFGDGRRLPALNAALRAGFGSYPQFYRVLREETGHTVATLRRSGSGSELPTRAHRRLGGEPDGQLPGASHEHPVPPHQLGRAGVENEAGAAPQQRADRDPGLQPGQ